MPGGQEVPPRRFPGTLLLAQDLGMSPTGKRRFSVAGEVVDIPVAALGDAVVGDYQGLPRERQHHEELWAWCQVAGSLPPQANSPWPTKAT